MRTMHFIARCDTATCERFNRANRHLIGAIFAGISRLGDGWMWLLMICLMPLLFGSAALRCALCLMANGALGALLVHFTKSRVHRPRPCERFPDLLLTVAPLDRFSFPSGHTQHAVSFTIIAASTHPSLGWFLYPFTVLVALSRLILGLHYLSDVVAGAAIGALLAGCSIGCWVLCGGSP